MHRPKDSQWDAVRETERHLLVAAGAGTGKTTTVIWKILYLLGVEVRGERILQPLRLSDIAAITFTNQAAADLKADLRAALREVGLRDLAYQVDLARIGTIHGFCGEVLREFALRSGRPPPRTVLEEGESAALVAEVVGDTVLEALEDGSVAGLDELLAGWSVGDLHGWLTRLALESDLVSRLLPAAAPGSAEALVLRLAGHAVARLNQRLERAGAVDFDRMIVWTRDLLRENDAVRRALQRRLRVLIVDEFQDVDPVQKEIAYLLGDPESGGSDTTRLMLVGDPKQSIYRFRRADVTVWKAVARDFEERGLGRLIHLGENFRSEAGILGFVDATVGKILQRPLGGSGHRDFEVEYRPVKASRGDAAALSCRKGPPPPGVGLAGKDAPTRREEPSGQLGLFDAPSMPEIVELILVPATGEGKRRKADEVRAIEAEAVGRRARELHDIGVAWKDMAVLLAGWGDLETYEAALRRHGAPTYALRTEGFYSRREVVDLILALETTRDPREDRALFGFLRSPFVGVADETLLRIARAAFRPYWDFFASRRAVLAELVPDAQERALLERGLDVLRRYAGLRDRLPIARLLEELLLETGYLAHLALLGEDGKQPLANVRQFLRMAAKFEEGGVGDFLRVVNAARAREDRVGDARLYGQTEDVVLITSIHSAKGLEWKVVFWCDLVRGAVADKAKLLVGRERMVLGDPELHARDQSAAWQAVARELEDAAAAERKRLWYVAATRAQDRLILSGIPLGDGKRYGAEEALCGVLPDLAAAAGAGSLEYAGHDGSTYRARVTVAPVVEPTVEDTGPGPVSEVSTLPPPLAPIAVPAGRRRRSATELLAYSRCAARHWFKYVVGLREPPMPRSGPEYESALVRGLIIHDVLEHLAEEEELDHLLEDAIGRWADDAPAPEQPRGSRYRKALRKEIEAVSGHADYRALAGRPEAHRELDFLYIDDDGAAYAAGAIDLAAPIEDGLALLDVKATKCSAAETAERASAYRPQQDVYVTAAAGIAGLPVTRFAFHFSRPNVQVGAELDAPSRAAARARFDELVAAVGTGRPELTRY
ncbi:MAG: UvrD-helicase domain-containing protein, partial [Gemmatimonadetes bacterium]|nr:UvrD-helicase domain-containing protein [Gemmatimonadota bacterium]